MKGYNVCLAQKAVCYKSYDDFQSLPIPIYQWKNFLMDFVTGLPISINWKKDSYNFILVIIDRLTRMVHYKPVKITINTFGLAEVIIDVVVRHYSFLNSIVTNQGFLFTANIWSLLCYFLGIKRRLFTIFYLQIDGQTKRQKSIIKAYLGKFFFWDQGDQGGFDPSIL